MRSSTLMLQGVRLYDLKKFPDDRGFFAEVFRKDWGELLDGEDPQQINLSLSYPGMIRAWHRHSRGQIDYFIVIEGSMKICAYDERRNSATLGELDEIVASAEKLQVVRVPGLYWHGTKTIGSEPSLTVYLVSRMYDYENPDEERRAWNDNSIVPKTINGKKEDPRVGRAWDWNYPPHK